MNRLLTAQGVGDVADGVANLFQCVTRWEMLRIWLLTELLSYVQRLLAGRVQVSDVGILMTEFVTAEYSAQPLIEGLRSWKDNSRLLEYAILLSLIYEEYQI